MSLPNPSITGDAEHYKCDRCGEYYMSEAPYCPFCSQNYDDSLTDIEMAGLTKLLDIYERWKFKKAV